MCPLPQISDSGTGSQHKFIGAPNLNASLSTSWIKLKQSMVKSRVHVLSRATTHEHAQRDLDMAFLSRRHVVVLCLDIHIQLFQHLVYRAIIVVYLHRIGVRKF